MSTHSKHIRAGALLALTGLIFSGPLGLVLVRALKPQPTWTTARSFATNYSIVQDIPYYFGFLLIAGMLMFIAAHYRHAKDESKAATLVAFSLAIVFATLIFLNYIIQIAFVRNLATDYRPEYDTAISIFSMANPMSLAWSVEMCGYAVLGVALWMLVDSYKHKKGPVWWLIHINGWLSLAGALFTVIDIRWVMTDIGLLCYLSWNIVMIVMMINIVLGRQRAEHRKSVGEPLL